MRKNETTKSALAVKKSPADMVVSNKLKADTIKSAVSVLKKKKTHIESGSNIAVLNNLAGQKQSVITNRKTAKNRQTATAVQDKADKDSNDSILNWYLNAIHKIPMLSREVEMETAIKARSGDREARNLLVRSNLRFVVTVARKYQSYGMSMMDLINEGNLGLLKAAEKFNPDRGYHFISYAVWWIKQSILFAIQQKSHLIRLPLNRTADLRRLEETERIIGNQQEDSSNFHSLASAMHMKPEDLNHLINMSRDHLSLDAPMMNGDDFSMGENIEDYSTILPDTRIEEDNLKRDLELSMENLTSRERKVLSLRFGLKGDPVLSLQKIGKKIGLSKERIRQIEKKAIRKIRTGKFGQNLGAYLS
jgi:RNA polymerase primary sigma factor